VGAVHNLEQLQQALKKTMSTLGIWSKKKFGNITRELAKLRSQLEELMNMNADRQDIRRVTDKMNELLYQEEMWWLQRSRISWLKEGDRNTKYFQSKAVWRARKNKIRELIDDNGTTHSDMPTMSAMANDYFQSIHTADPNLNHAPVLNLLEARVTDDDNNKLCEPFTEEIADALFQIGPLKAPGPDGFSARFFQHNWSTLRDNITKSVKEFFVTGVMPEGVKRNFYCSRTQNSKSIKIDWLQAY
jgi:hypothetical protein